jgi:hypothetical protein
MNKNLVTSIILHKHTPYVFGALVIFILAILHHIAGSLVLTGDEPRYLYSAVSLGTQGNLSLAPDQWANWLAIHKLNTSYLPERGVHSIAHLLAMVPVITTMGLEAGRWLQLILVSSIAILYWQCLMPKYGVQSMIWLLVYFVSIPLLPYFSLIYSEAWLFLLLSIATLYVVIPERSSRQKYCILFCLIGLPFVHLRSVLLVVVLGTYFFWQELGSQQRSTRQILTMIGLVLLSLPLFVYYQISLTGSLTGTASSMYEPSLSLLSDRLAGQFMGYRHGLFLYCPLALIGFAGLVLGCIKNDPLIRLLALALLAYIATFIWGVASESYTARFWVVVMPLIIVGTIYWVTEVKTALKWLVATPLVIITLINAGVFVAKPDLYLNNRFGSTSYEYLAQKIAGLFDFNLIAAADQYDARFIIVDSNWNLTVLIMLTVFVMGLTAFGFRHSHKSGFALCLMIFTLVIYKSLAIPISPTQYEITRTETDTVGWLVKIDFHQPTKIRGLRFGSYMDAPNWGDDPHSPRQFVISGIDSEGHQTIEQRLPGFQLTSLIKSEVFSSITILVHNPVRSEHWYGSKISVF